MPLPSGFPATNGTLNSLAFWELNEDDTYPAIQNRSNMVTIGRTVVIRYHELQETTVRGLCAIADADDFEAVQGTSATLTWHYGTSFNVIVMSVDTKRYTHLAVAEITVGVRIL